MKINGNNLKIAVQKKGRLSDSTVTLLQKIGLDFDSYTGRIFVRVRNFNLDILFVRDDDIPEYVQDGVCELGIVGSNIVEEGKANVTVREQLGFGVCQLVIAAPRKGPIQSLSALQGKRIATSYPAILKRFLKKNSIDAQIVEISGSVEITPSLNVADAICDLVSSGSTLRTHGLFVLEPVMNSEAVLIQSRQIAETKKPFIEQLLMRIRGVLQAQRTKYIMLNAPESALEEIKKVVPGLKSPTVMPLAIPGMIAIHSVVPEDTFWEVIEKLKKCGASGILVLPIEKMII